MANKGKDWTEDEIIITYYYYVKNNYSKHKADELYLANLFDRTFGSIDWKLSNLKNFETHGNNLDKKVATYYNSNLDKLENDAKNLMKKFVEKDNDSRDLLEKIFGKREPKYKEIIDDSDLLEEGAKYVVSVNKYERDPKLRLQAIQIHGVNCMVCGFNFKDEWDPTNS